MRRVSIILPLLIEIATDLLLISCPTSPRPRPLDLLKSMDSGPSEHISTNKHSELSGWGH